MTWSEVQYPGSLENNLRLCTQGYNLKSHPTDQETRMALALSNPKNNGEEAEAIDSAEAP